MGSKTENKKIKMFSLTTISRITANQEPIYVRSTIISQNVRLPELLCIALRHTKTGYIVHLKGRKSKKTDYILKVRCSAATSKR